MKISNKETCEPVSGSLNSTQGNGVGEEKETKINRVAQKNFKKTSTKAKRCSVSTCSKKIPFHMQAIVCACGKVFCSKHRDKISHKCDSDTVVKVTTTKKISSNNNSQNINNAAF